MLLFGDFRFLIDGLLASFDMELEVIRVKFLKGFQIVYVRLTWLLFLFAVRLLKFLNTLAELNKG